MIDDTQIKTMKKNGMRILLVEDNPINQIIVSGILLQWGVSITSAGNGIEAIDLMKKNTFDLVLMDIQMPKLDGVSATKVIREKLKDRTPVVAMTAYVTEEEHRRCLDAGMNEFISKPVDRDYLSTLLDKYFDQNYKEEEALNQPKNDYQQDFMLDGIELYDAVNRLNCNYNEFSEILQNFCEFYETIGKKLKNMFASRNFQDLKREAHSIKGAAGNISAINLYLSAREFEEILKAGKEEFFEKHIDELVSKFDEVFQSNHLLKEQITKELSYS